VQRAITLTRGGGETFGSVKLTTTASAQNKLVTDPANGLQLTIEQCPTAWTASGNTWSCSATPTPVIAKRAVIGTGLDLVAPVASLNSRQQSFLRITLTLPTEANNDFQGLSNALTFTFDALQRAGQPK
jgi:spore coat-associated protein N